MNDNISPKETIQSKKDGAVEPRMQVFLIIKEHIIELLKILEKQRYAFVTYNTKNIEIIQKNMFHEKTCEFINKMLENLLNYIHHTINNRLDTGLNEVFDEVRMILFIHNSCLVQKYVDIFKVLYDNIDKEQLNYDTLEEYLDSIECDARLILRIQQTQILESLTECDIRCKMAYDPQINPIESRIIS